MWNIIRTVKKGNYIYAVVPEHPRATKNGYVLEHRVVVENSLGRLLEPNEQIHHVDGNRHNNAAENLRVVLNGEHQRLHQTKYPDGHFVGLVCDHCGARFTRAYRNRPSVKGNENAFCSRRCSGLHNGFRAGVSALPSKQDTVSGR